MVFDALDAFTFSGATGVTPTADKSGAVFTQTGYSDALDFKKGGTGITSPMFVLVRYNAGSTTNGASTVTFNVQTSSNGSDWFDRTSGAKDAVALSSGTAAKGTVALPVTTTDRYVRVAVVVSGSGTAPTIAVLSADLNISPIN